MATRWKPELETGHPRIDADHRELLEIISAMEAASLCGDGGHARGLLGEFLSASGAHFAREEALMVEVAYAEAVAHRDAHALFLDDLRRFLKSGPPPESPGFRLYLSSRLLGWFVQHIRAHDALLAAAARQALPRAASPGAASPSP